MKIAHVIRTYSRVEWGGVQDLVSSLAKYQRLRGDDARIFCTDALQPPEGTQEAEAFPYVYPYFPLTEKKRRGLDQKGGDPYSSALIRAVRAFEPDVIHIHASRRLACAAVKLAEELGAVSVLSMNGDERPQTPNEMARIRAMLWNVLHFGPVIDFVRGTYFSPIGRASAVISSSREQGNAILRRHPEQKVRYLPLGTSSKRYEHRPFEKARNVLCLSRIDYHANQASLVELLEAFPEMRIRLIGPVFSLVYRDKVLDYAKKRGVADRLRIDRPLTPADAGFHEAFAEADAFVLPTLGSTAGLSALEAMAHGVPVVTAATGGLVDFVRDGENGLLFDPTRKDALAKAFERLTPELAATLVAGAYETAKERSWPALIDRLARYYGELRR